MNFRIQGLRLLCLLALASCGCVRTAVVKFLQPAGLDVSHLDRIAVMGFTGDHGETLASSLSGELHQKDFYTVVNPLQLESEVMMASFVSSEDPIVPTLQGILGPARAEGLDGVVVGKVVEYRCEDKTVSKSPFKLAAESPGDMAAKQDNRLLDRRDSTVREGKVTVSFQLVDVESGEVRAEHEVSHHFEALLDGGNSVPTHSEVLEQLTEHCVNDIVSLLTPHEGISTFQMAKGAVWKRGRRQIREGSVLAEQGDWAAAEAKWQAALEKDPANHAAIYNLALVADHKRDYAEAEKLAMQAVRLQYNDCYANGLETIRAHRAASSKTADQRDEMLDRIFDDEWH